MHGDDRDLHRERLDVAEDLDAARVGDGERRLLQVLLVDAKSVGVATALVPRGDITPPTAPVRAWRVPCTPRDTSLEQAVEAVDLPTRDGIASPAAHLPYYRIYRVRELP